MRYKLVPALPSDRDWLEALRRAVYQDLFVATWGAWDEARHQRHFAECIELGEINIIELNESVPESFRSSIDRTQSTSGRSRLNRIDRIAASARESCWTSSPLRASPGSQFA